ncbi:uncharacterized protein LOC123865110 [Maniola jurtina]|uniref:uncharacterized protein LOC123865110 n=1 Tax=Maniola jurtina TaxID=191418 RepID=UPI001E68D7CF|nr:uncharacterized protein LOC123865110 [Maniola jurtina]
MAGIGVLGGASGVLAAEVCAPLLLLCWLCCWPDDDRSDSSSEMHPQKPVISNESSSRHRHRSNELFGRRGFASSAVSLHLPSTSGQTKQPLSAHRSHEEIRGRRKSHFDPNEQETRYHSAPSVIDEVLHRRDWERSTKDLYIPLKSDNEFSNTSDVSDKSEKDDSVLGKSDEQIINKPCKKHHKNIKSSRKTNLNKESLNDDVKDQDVTETITNFYIGESSNTTSPEYTNEVKADDNTKTVYKPKEAKQSLNESIRTKDRQRPLVPLTEYQVTGFDALDGMELDRSGAVHHSVESRSSLYNTHSIPAPPPSVEAVGYEWEASYLEETGTAGVWRAPAPVPPPVLAPVGWSRARHASAGDVLAPVVRPQSGALSESDLDFELEGCDEPPPAYDEVQLLASLDKKETAI